MLPLNLLPPKSLPAVAARSCRVVLQGVEAGVRTGDCKFTDEGSGLTGKWSGKSPPSGFVPSDRVPPFATEGSTCARALFNGEVALVRPTFKRLMTTHIHIDKKN